MAITRQQIIDFGFKPTKRKRGLGTRKYDSLMYKLSDKDYLYLGYNDFRGNTEFKTLWKSIETEEGRVSYPIKSIGSLTLTSLKEYVESTLALYKLKEESK